MTTPVSVSVEIKAPVEKVWAMITDLPRMGEWSPENKGGEWMKGATTAAVGAS
ncbi:MAG: SRPBCC family protein, partial [Ilumatobacteraceae bacterium]